MSLFQELIETTAGQEKRLLDPEENTIQTIIACMRYSALCGFSSIGISDADEKYIEIFLEKYDGFSYTTGFNPMGIKFRQLSWKTNSEPTPERSVATAAS